MQLPVEDVFKLQGVPTITFVPPIEYEALKVALRTRGRGIVIEGPSGIGKTTAVRTALHELSQAGQVPYPDILELSARKPDDVDIIAALPGMEDIGMVVVDDFHRLSEAVRLRLADLLKTLADGEVEGSKLILVGINRAGEALVRLSPDLNNRINVFSFEANPAERVREVFQKGSEALNVEFEDPDQLAAAAHGSFYLAQMLGHQLCVGSGITETQESRRTIEKPLEEVRAEIFQSLDRIFYPPTRDFCRGMKPRPRGNAPYMRLLYWLAKEENWFISVPHKLNQEPEHRGSVGQIADKGYVAALIERNEDIAQVLSWDDSSQLLAVQDPQYVFYLKNILWSKLPRRIGYRSVAFPPHRGARYDVALSFAGTDRGLARAIFEDLTDRGFEVFFDENEESRILAESVADYLAPIYASESKFVVVLLGPDYPNRIWTRFESDQFEVRFGENAVIPIWFKNAAPQMFDKSRQVGGLTFDPAEPIAEQVARFGDKIEKKLEAVAFTEPSPDEVAAEIEEPPIAD